MSYRMLWWATNPLPFFSRDLYPAPFFSVMCVVFVFAFFPSIFFYFCVCDEGTLEQTASRVFSPRIASSHLLAAPPSVMPPSVRPRSSPHCSTFAQAILVSNASSEWALHSPSLCCLPFPILPSKPFSVYRCDLSVMAPTGIFLLNVLFLSVSDLGQKMVQVKKVFISLFFLKKKILGQYEHWSHSRFFLKAKFQLKKGLPLGACKVHFRYTELQAK